MPLIIDLKSRADLEKFSGVRAFRIKGMFVEFYVIGNGVIYRAKEPLAGEINKEELELDGWVECENIGLKEAK